MSSTGPPSGNAPPNNLKPINTRASFQPQPVPRTPSGTQNLISPRPLGINPAHGRPTSELLNPGTASISFQTPEVDAIDQWFENLQNYETTLEEMAAASLDANFKEELSAIEQWFRVLSEAERTAALYSLLQHSTQMQIRFFITVLQQMARSDPMTALLSPNVGASMQNQMDQRLATMGMNGFKSAGLPASPSARTFSSSLNRQSVAGETGSFLSPDSANNISAGTPDAAATLAQQRAKLKANAAHRISAPGTLAQFSEGMQRGGSVWPSSTLGQVVERAPSPNPREANKLSPPLPSSARPKSTDFSGVANSFRSPRVAQVHNEGQSLDDQLSPMVGGNWASMVNTPVAPMFANPSDSSTNRTPSNDLDAATLKLASWNISNNNSNRVVLDDARKYRRVSGTATKNEVPNDSSVVYGDDGEPINGLSHSQQQQTQQLQSQLARNSNTSFAANLRNGGGVGGATSGNNGGSASRADSSNTGNNAWSNQRSPALSSTRFGAASNDGSDLASAALANAHAQAQAQALAMAQMGLNMPGFNMFNPNLSPLLGAGAGGGMMSPGGMEGLAMQQAQAQLFAAQLAASGYNPAAAFGMGGLQAAAALQQQQQQMAQQQQQQQQRSGNRGGGRSPGNLTKSSSTSRDSGGGKDKGEDDVDVTLLNDIPAWLRSLRLHKYTPNFEGMAWKDMVVMSEAELEAKGVAALGARRKLLKTFEGVRAKMGLDAPPGVGNSIVGGVLASSTTGSPTRDGVDVPNMGEDGPASEPSIA